MTTVFSRVVDVVGSTFPRRRARLFQWAAAAYIYLGAGLWMVAGVQQGWISQLAATLWVGFVLVALALGYAALRSGWTERYTDPSITLWQLSIGVLLANWAYLICGPMRTAALLPMMVTIVFGAFTLRWRQIACLTALNMLALFAAVLFLAVFPQWLPAQGEVSPVMVDINNLLMLVVVLPPLGVIAARLSSVRRKLQDQREALMQALSEVERLAVSDELTGIANRRSMRALLERSAALSSREIAPFCVALIDIDHFKAINDELGHAGGDEVLKAFAHRATALLRSTDAIGRWGGEEFVLLACGNIDSACSILERIRKAVARSDTDTPPVTFSAGVAQHRRGETPDELLERADIALYEAKRTGRDRHVVAPGGAVEADHCSATSP